MYTVAIFINLHYFQLNNLPPSTQIQNPLWVNSFSLVTK